MQRGRAVRHLVAVALACSAAAQAVEPENATEAVDEKGAPPAPCRGDQAATKNARATEREELVVEAEDAGGNVPAATETPGVARPTSKVLTLPEVVVEGRKDSLIGIADSAGQGTTGAAQLADRPTLRAGEILE